MVDHCSSRAYAKRAARPNEPRISRRTQKCWRDGPHVLWKMSGSMVDHCPPQAYAKRGASPNEPPALEFFGGLKNTDAPRVLWKISRSMVDHCSSRAYAKRGARPTEPPALEFFQMPQKCWRPAHALENATVRSRGKIKWCLLTNAVMHYMVLRSPKIAHCVAVQNYCFF